MGLLLALSLLDGRYTTSLVGELLVGGQSSENISLAKRQKHLGLILGVIHNKVLNLGSQSTI